MKAVIAGASLAGLFTAYLLSKDGVEVEVYEREFILGPPSRTLIVTSEIQNLLPPLPSGLIVNKVKRFQLFSRSNGTELVLRRPDLVVEREGLVKFLANLAQEKGARIFLGHWCEGFSPSPPPVRVTLRNLETGEALETEADVLIGADGHKSRVNLIAFQNSHPLTALLQAKVALPAEVGTETVQIWFDSDRTRYFYWLIPESEKVGVVGLIAEDLGRAHSCLEAFLNRRNWRPMELQFAWVPLYRFKMGRDGLSHNGVVYTVGDAAAQVKVTTVGGVVTGLHGAKALAESLLRGRDYSETLKPLKLELNLHLLVRQVLNRFSEEDYDELIGLIRGRLKEVLQEWNRDELKRFFLRLILAEPRLIRLGAKVLLRSLLPFAS